MADVMPVMCDIKAPQGDSASIQSKSSVDNQFQTLADCVGTMRISEDPGIPSNEGGATDSSAGANSSTATGMAHFRAPSLSLTPPVANGLEDLRGTPTTSGSASSIDSRLGMSEVAAALEDVRNSDNSSAFLRPQSPAAVASPSQGRASRRRSSSFTIKPPHDVADEEHPKEHFLDSACHKAFLRAKQVMSDFTSVLSNASTDNDPDSTMKRLHAEAANLARFCCPSTRTVAFVGDSGVGKSSLLNSLLDYRDLARTTSVGGACTCVVTEYHYHNTNDFAIEVQWFTINDIAAQLTDLLRSYRCYHLGREGSIDFKDQANVAKYTFQAMFRGRLENEAFLTQSPEETVLETLLLWARELIPSSGNVREVHASLKDCSERLLRLTSVHNSTPELAIWPYISKVKVFLNAYILSNGLVLADLPGLRDLNAARRNITERYLLDCEKKISIFAVCSISRAETDTSVMSVFNLAREAELSNVGIVCTMSDDIEWEEARKDWPGERANKIQLLVEAIGTDKHEFEHCEADLTCYAGVDKSELWEDELQHIAELTERSMQARKRKNQHEFELKQYLIRTRNTEVRQELINMYQDVLSGNELEVFCISNKDYWKHRTSPKESAFPFLQLSGIFDVRRQCISMVAKSQLVIAIKYVTDQIPHFLGEVEIWVKSGSGSMDAERKEKIRETLNGVEVRLKQELIGDTSKINRIDSSLTKLFRDEISTKQRTDSWCRAAIDASILWSNTYPAITYKYFCQHFGYHETPTVGEHNWNEEAIDRMVRDLNAPWRSLRSTLQKSLEQDIEFIKGVMDRAIIDIDAELPDSLDSAHALCRTMRSRQGLLVTDLEQAFEKFEARLSTLRTDAFSGLRTSLIGLLMEQSYAECNAQEGRYSHAKRSKIITNRLSDESVFVILQARFRSRFRALAEILQSDFEKVARSHLLSIKNTLDIIRNDNVALESERDQEFRRAVERKVKGAKNEIDGLQFCVTAARL